MLPKEIKKTKNISQVVIEFLEKDYFSRDWYYNEEVIQKKRMTEFHKAIIKYCNIKDKKDKRYYYLITFTLSDENKDVDPTKVYKYIKTRLKAEGLKVVKAHLVQELTQQGRPHWHASVKSSKYISKDRFKYYVNKFGFVDINKNHSQNYETMYKYITKSNTAEQIKGDLLEST